MAKKQTGNKRYSTRKTAGEPQNKRRRLRRILFSIAAFAVVAATIFFLVLRSGGQVSIFENAVGSLVSPVQNAFSTVANKLRGFVNTWHSYDALQADYNAIAFENEQLRMELVTAEEACRRTCACRSCSTPAAPMRRSIRSTRRSSRATRARGSRPSRSTAARATASARAWPWSMGDGLIGRVYEVGLNYSKVISIIDTQSSVACLMQRTRDNGIMRGQISDSDSAAECYVYYLPNINSITPATWW